MHDDYDRSSKWLIQHRGNSILRLGGVHRIQSWRPLQAEVVQPRQLPDGLLEIGLIPWVPLTQFEGPPDPILRECRERIDQQAAADEKANLLAVSQVLARLRYNDLQLLSIFGGSRIMIESPLIQELMAENGQKYILTVLETRFGTVPEELAVELRGVMDEQKLRELTRLAVKCSDLAAFRAKLVL